MSVYTSPCHSEQQLPVRPVMNYENYQISDLLILLPREIPGCPWLSYQANEVHVLKS